MRNISPLISQAIIIEKDFWDISVFYLCLRCLGSELNMLEDDVANVAMLKSTFLLMNFHAIKIILHAA